MTANEIATTIIRYVATPLREDDFAFSVVVDDAPWDVYNFTMPLDAPAELQGNGMLAFHIVDGQIEIGFFDLGRHHTADDIERALKRQSCS